MSYVFRGHLTFKQRLELLLNEKLELEKSDGL